MHLAAREAALELVIMVADSSGGQRWETLPRTAGVSVGKRELVFPVSHSEIHFTRTV